MLQLMAIDVAGMVLPFTMATRGRIGSASLWPIVDIEDADAAFHTVYDLDERYQLPGWAHLRQGFKRPIHAIGPDDGKGAHWRGIYDDQGRLMVAISYNSDVGDAWEWADEPQYPEKCADLAIRLGINYITYAMTH